MRSKSTQVRSGLFGLFLSVALFLCEETGGVLVLFWYFGSGVGEFDLF